MWMLGDTTLVVLVAIGCVHDEWTSVPFAWSGVIISLIQLPRRVSSAHTVSIHTYITCTFRYRKEICEIGWKNTWCRKKENLHSFVIGLSVSYSLNSGTTQGLRSHTISPVRHSLLIADDWAENLCPKFATLSDWGWNQTPPMASTHTPPDTLVMKFRASPSWAR